MSDHLYFCELVSTWFGIRVVHRVLDVQLLHSSLHKSLDELTRGRVGVVNPFIAVPKIPPVVHVPKVKRLRPQTLSYVSMVLCSWWIIDMPEGDRQGDVHFDSDGVNMCCIHSYNSLN